MLRPSGLVGTRRWTLPCWVRSAPRLVQPLPSNAASLTSPFPGLSSVTEAKDSARISATAYSPSSTGGDRTMRPAAPIHWLSVSCSPLVRRYWIARTAAIAAPTATADCRVPMPMPRCRSSHSKVETISTNSASARSGAARSDDAAVGCGAARCAQNTRRRMRERIWGFGFCGVTSNGGCRDGYGTSTVSRFESKAQGEGRAQGFTGTRRLRDLRVVKSFVLNRSTNRSARARRSRRKREKIGSDLTGQNHRYWT